MEIYIKNMVCGRCIASVQHIFEKHKIRVSKVELGLVITKTTIANNDLTQIAKDLIAEGFEILEDSSAQKIEKIKNLLLHEVQSLQIDEDFRISDYLSAKFHKEYSSISKLFSQMENVTLEQYFILLKIEKVKELLFYGESTLTQIADMLGYKTVQHLSAQFKKVTGFSPSEFQKVKKGNRKPLDKIS